MCGYTCVSTVVPAHLGCLRQGLSLAWSPLLVWLASEPQRGTCPAKLNTGVTGVNEFGGSNSNPHACKASPVPTELLSKSLKDL